MRINPALPGGEMIKVVKKQGLKNRGNRSESLIPDFFRAY